MQLLDVYTQNNTMLAKGNGTIIYDEKGEEFVDFYGGHGVISIGHNHPEFVDAVKHQLDQLVFYSNAFVNPLQKKVAKRLGKLSEYNGYNLFLSNSGAEANENALKVASFFTKRQKILAVKGAFHGRSSGAVAVTDNPNIQAAFGSQAEVDFVEMNNVQSLIQQLSTRKYAAFIIEGIQGVNGVWEATHEFWKAARLLCTQSGTLLIADEIQSGYGRSGKFFAHQYHHVMADVITVAKGMGNGFPVAGTLINPAVKIEKGMLGSTFGGGHLACAAAHSVLKVIEQEGLIMNAAVQGGFLKDELTKMPGVKSVRGRGLMLGIEFEESAKEIKKILFDEHGIITGFSTPDVLRILPPLSLSGHNAELFIRALKLTLKRVKEEKLLSQSKVLV